MIEKTLWEAADDLRANSNLTSQEYSKPILGRVFLKYADNKFSVAKEKLEGSIQSSRITIGPDEYQAEGVMYLPEKARFSNLVGLPEVEDIVS